MSGMCPGNLQCALYMSQKCETDLPIVSVKYLCLISLPNISAKSMMTNICVSVAVFKRKTWFFLFVIQPLRNWLKLTFCGSRFHSAGQCDIRFYRSCNKFRCYVWASFFAVLSSVACFPSAEHVHQNICPVIILSKSECCAFGWGCRSFNYLPFRIVSRVSDKFQLEKKKVTAKKKKKKRRNPLLKAV